MTNKESNTSAVTFNYDKLKELLDIDFEREERIEEKEETPSYRF